MPNGSEPLRQLRNTMTNQTANLTIKTIFDRGAESESQMVFFTESDMKQHNQSYTYAFDESRLYQSDQPILGQIEIGPDFVTRSISGDENYVMHFKEGYKERIVYQTPDGSFVTDVATLNIDIDMENGFGIAHILYRISFAESESMVNEIRISVEAIK